MSKAGVTDVTQAEANNDQPAAKAQDKPIGNQKQDSKATLIVTWVAMAALAASSLYLSLKVQKMEEQTAFTPPVVIIDFVRLVDSYGSDVDSGDLEARMMQTREQVEALRDAGYLVLDANNVIAAPDALFLPVEKAQ